MNPYPAPVWPDPKPRVPLALIIVVVVVGLLAMSCTTALVVLEAKSKPTSGQADEALAASLRLEEENRPGLATILIGEGLSREELEQAGLLRLQARIEGVEELDCRGGFAPTQRRQACRMMTPFGYRSVAAVRARDVGTGKPELDFYWPSTGVSAHYDWHEDLEALMGSEVKHAEYLSCPREVFLVPGQTMYCYYYHHGKKRPFWVDFMSTAEAEDRAHEYWYQDFFEGTAETPDGEVAYRAWVHPDEIGPEYYFS